MEYRDDAIAALVYSDAQVLLVFADTEERLAGARAAALSAGCRIAEEAGIAGGADRLQPPIGADAVLVSAAAASPELERLLDRLAQTARQGTLKGVVDTPFALIDMVAAVDLPNEVAHLADADPAMLADAVAVAAERAPARLHDVGRGAAVLQQLSEEAARIATTLATLSGAGRGGDDCGREDGPPVNSATVRAIIRARRLRDQYFPSEMFADPGFDMLLDLYAARLEGSRVAVSSLCIAAAVPATTALRWIRALTDQGMFVRSADPHDGRRVYISLSDEAAQSMARYLEAVHRSGLPAV